MSIIPVDKNPFNRNNDISSFDEQTALRMAPLEEGPPVYDYWGAVYRRKWLIIFLAVIGAGLGYLLYSKTPPVFASNSRIMIWTQAPPSIVNGDTVVQQVSIPKHQNLISSQMVLASAIKKGKLDQLETFHGSPMSMLQLKSMLKVRPVAGAADALDLTVQGANPKDLPTILEKVVDAYIEVLNDDTRSLGEEMSAMIDRFQVRIVEEKSAAEEAYFNLLQQHELSYENDNGRYVNPYVKQIDQASQIRNQRQRELQDIGDRIKSLEDLSGLAALPPERRSDLLKVISLEAVKYLQLNGTSSNPNDANNAQFDMIGRLRNRIGALDDAIAQKELKLRTSLKQYGENHPTPSTLRSDLEFMNADRKDLQEKLKQEIGQEAQAKKSDSGMSPEKLNEETARLYLTSLLREEKRVKASITALDKDIDALEKDANKISADINQVNVLSSQIKQKDTFARELLDRVSEINMIAGKYTTTKVRIIDYPAIGMLVAPKLWQYLGLATLAATLLGAGAAVVLDRADLTFRSPTEIAYKLQMPVITKIPVIKPFKPKKGTVAYSPMMTTLGKPRSPASEAFRTCRTAIMFSMKQTGAKSFLFTSPSAGDGKSTTVTNLAVSFAQGGQRVVIVDGDLRRPRCHVYLGEEKSPGLKDFAEGLVEMDKIIRPSSVQDNLYIVPSGGHVANPGEFVVSERFQELLRHLNDKFDVVLVDSPPLLPVADATSISTYVDGVVLVFRIRKGVVLTSQKAREQLDKVHANVVGIIVNGVDNNPYYDEYGRYGYSGYGNYYARRYYEAENRKYYAER